MIYGYWKHQHISLVKNSTTGNTMFIRNPGPQKDNFRLEISFLLRHLYLNYVVLQCIPLLEEASIESIKRWTFHTDFFKNHRGLFPIALRMRQSEHVCRFTKNSSSFSPISRAARIAIKGSKEVKKVSIFDRRAYKTLLTTCIQLHSILLKTSKKHAESLISVWRQTSGRTQLEKK